MDKREIFAFLATSVSGGRRAALVSLVGASGASMREPGAHMAVAEDGAFVGSLSGGCIERAVIAEAIEVLNTATPRMTRFGQGSRFIDIRLPCGGSVDLHFQPLRDDVLSQQVLRAIDARQPFALELPTDAGSPRFVPRWQPTAWDAAQDFATVGHWPNPRLLIVGHGAAVAKVAWQGRAWGAEISVITPDKVLANGLSEDGFCATVIGWPEETGPLVSDAWTAIVFLFHDHEWEPPLIAHALRQPHFFLGAMGSRRAHAARSEALCRLGVPEREIGSISAPIGLFHSVRDPATLAISVLAEVADRFRNHGVFSAQMAAQTNFEIRQIG